MKIKLTTTETERNDRPKQQNEYVMIVEDLSKQHYDQSGNKALISIVLETTRTKN